MNEDLDIKNRVLYNQFKILAETAFAILNGHLDALPYETKQCITITEGGGGSEYIGYTPSFWGFIETYKYELAKTSEFISCIKTIEKDNSINKDIEITDFLIQFLIKLAREKEFFVADIKQYLDEVRKRKNELFKFNVDIFNQLYRIYEKYLYSDRQIIALAHLRGFELESDDLDLESFFKIKRMSGNELEKLWYDYPAISMFSKSSSIRMIKYCIITEQKNMADIRTEFDPIVTSLRLWNKGDVGYDTIYYFSKWNPHGGRISGGESIFFGHPPLILELTKIEEFKNFYNKIKKIKSTDYGFLSMAINRFNNTYERKRQEDKLIDFMIAFEALFMKETQELRHRLSVRIACFLKDGYVDRKDLCFKFKTIYDIRSEIVHGDPISQKYLKKLGVTSIFELVYEVEEHLRASIKKFIDLIDQDETYNHEEFLDRLDMYNVGSSECKPREMDRP